MQTARPYPVDGCAVFRSRQGTDKFKPVCFYWATSTVSETVAGQADGKGFVVAANAGNSHFPEGDFLVACHPVCHEVRLRFDSAMPLGQRFWLGPGACRQDNVARRAAPRFCQLQWRQPSLSNWVLKSFGNWARLSGTAPNAGVFALEGSIRVILTNPPAVLAH